MGDLRGGNAAAEAGGAAEGTEGFSAALLPLLASAPRDASRPGATDGTEMGDSRFGGPAASSVLVGGFRGPFESLGGFLSGLGVCTDVGWGFPDEVLAGGLVLDWGLDGAGSVSVVAFEEQSDGAGREGVSRGGCSGLSVLVGSFGVWGCGCGLSARGCGAWALLMVGLTGT